MTAKKIITYDSDGLENGYLVELKKNGRFTESYLTVAYSGCFKGFHEHKVREANYICIRGAVRVILYIKGKRVEHMLQTYDTLNIGINIPTALQNDSNDEAWIINNPYPVYDPEIAKWEQVEWTIKELEEEYGK